MSGFREVVFALCLFTGLGVNAVWASTSQIATLVYKVAHDRYGDIGKHTISFEQQNDNLIVEIKSRITVKVMFWSYRYESDQKETWRNGKLIAYDGSVRDDNYTNGNRIEVKARAKGDKLLIEGPEGLVEAPGNIVSSHPWNPKIVQQKQLMDAKTGVLKTVNVRAADNEVVEVAGTPVEARKYLITGDMQRELWYTDDGRCVKMRFKKRGGDITFTPTTTAVMDQQLLARLING